MDKEKNPTPTSSRKKKGGEEVIIYVPGKSWVFKKVQRTSGKAESRGSRSAIRAMPLSLLPQLSLLAKLESFYRLEPLFTAPP